MRLSRRECFSLAPALTMTAACATSPSNPVSESIVIESQGSFYVGGRQVTASGTYDDITTQTPASSGQTYWVDQMYVQYQIPPNARTLPLVFVHGGSGTGASWESTPDGREGFQTIFLRRGFPVYIVDAPRGGRSALPSFTGDFGKLDDTQQIIPARTTRPGREQAWSRWRMGARYPEVFPVQEFPIDAVDSFLKGVRPIASDDADVISQAIVALLDKIGPAILVTHSNSGVWGWLTGARSRNVKAIVSYEPAFVFPSDEMPQLPLVSGAQKAGTPVSAQEFASLAKIPVQVVYGDNIPTRPVPELTADGRRGQVLTSVMFADALNRKGGNASVLKLPDVGLRGNSHFMFSDRNNVQVADQLSAFLSDNGLDQR